MKKRDLDQLFRDAVEVHVSRCRTAYGIPKEVYELTDRGVHYKLKGQDSMDDNYNEFYNQEMYMETREYLVEEDTYVDLVVTELLRQYPLSEEDAYTVAEDFLYRNIRAGRSLDTPLDDARRFDHSLIHDIWERTILL